MEKQDTELNRWMPMAAITITQDTAAYPIIDAAFNQVHEEIRLLAVKNIHLSKPEVAQCNYEQILRIDRVINLFEHYQAEGKIEMFWTMAQSIIKKTYPWTIYHFKRRPEFDFPEFKQFLAIRLKEEAIDEVSWKCYCFSGLILAYIRDAPINNIGTVIEEICTFHKRPNYILNNADRKRINKLKKSSPDEWQNLALPIRKNSMAKMISLRENISIISLMNGINLGEKDMESWLMIVMQDENIAEDTKGLSGESMEVYTFGLYLMIALRAYKSLRKSLLQFTVSHNGHTPPQNIINDNQKLHYQLEEERRTAGEKLTKLEKEFNLYMVQKEKEIRKLKQKIISMDEDRKELIAIREYLFSKQGENKMEGLIVGDDFSDLSDIKICIVGGSISWQKTLKEKFPKWKYLDKSALNFDKNLFQNIDFVYINTFQLNHPFYYKITSALRNKSIQMHFVKNTNIQLFLQQIGSDINNFE